MKVIENRLKRIEGKQPKARRIRCFKMIAESDKDQFKKAMLENGHTLLVENTCFRVWS